MVVSVKVEAFISAYEFRPIAGEWEMLLLSVGSSERFEFGDGTPTGDGGYRQEPISKIGTRSNARRHGFWIYVLVLTGRQLM
jgi:hypothetical protein